MTRALARLGPLVALAWLTSPAMCGDAVCMRFVFLEVDTERSWAVASIGPGFIASYLRAHGLQVAG